MNRLISKILEIKHNKDFLTIWMNNLIVLYAFFIPITGTVNSKIFIGILILFILRGNVWFHIKEAFENKVVQAFLSFFLLYIIWLIGSDDIHNAIRSISKVKHVIYIVIFYAIIDGRYINKVLGAFIVAMFISELLSYSMLFGIIPWEIHLYGIKIYQSYRIGDASPFTHHIHYGVLLAFTVVLLFQRVLYGNLNKYMKLFLSIFMFTASLNIFLTGGRTGYFTFFVLILFLLFMYLRKYFIVGLISVGLFFMLAYEISPMMNKKVSETIISIQKVNQEKIDFKTSLGTRLGIIYYSIPIIKDNFLFGVGTGDSFYEISKRVPTEDKFLANKNILHHEHNVYLSVLLQFGIIGFFIFMNIFYRIVQFDQAEKDLKLIQLSITLALATAFLTEMFELRIFLPLWALIIAITMRSRSHHIIADKHIPSDKKALLQIIFAGLLIYLAAMVNKYIF